jgi:hypothetical protein
MAENHAIHLGKLVGNIQSLESLLRFVLVTTENKRAQGSKRPPSYWNMSAGDVVAEDASTNFDTLGQLIGKFNAIVGAHDAALCIDLAVVGLRDLLAHGRIAADAKDERRIAILKFSKPIDGKVNVEASALMSETWFDAQQALMRVQLGRVETALRKFAS